MEKYNSESLNNIKSIIQMKTDVTFESASNKKGYIVKRYAVLAIGVMCFIFLSAFTYYKFNSLSGDDLALSSVYLGDGKFEVIVSNLSEHDLRLQNNIKVMQWSTGEEVKGKNGLVHVNANNILAGETGIVNIDISQAYDIEQLQKNLKKNDWYYFILTNNNFIFGQDWICSFDFNIKNEDEAIASHNDFVEFVNENESYTPQYETGILAFDDCELPVKEMKISGYYGMQSNGMFSDHINIAGYEGDEIYAVHDGIITDAGFDSIYGNYIEISIDEQTIVKYGHLKASSVAKGESVKKSDVIGYMGKTGSATGVNLLFSVKVNGEYINPLRLAEVK